MVTIEIPENPNCAAMDLRDFHDVGQPQPVHRVLLAQPPEPAQWCDVTGWTAAGASCPAVAQKVDDSGEGVAFLIRGGDAGLRLQPSGRATPWRLDDADQWGEPFLILPSLEDIMTEPHHG